MAIELLGSGNDNLSFGDLPLGGLTGLTVAFTIDTAASLGSTRLIGQWLGAGEYCFLVSLIDTDEIGFVVAQTDITSTWYGEKTTDSPLTTSTLLRVLCRWSATSDLDIWVNGSANTTTSWFSGTPSSLKNATVNVNVAEYAGVDGVDGDYSEIAIWNHKVPDWVAEAYGKGMSPRFYRNGGLLYVSAVNSGHLIDEWEGNTVSNTGGVTAPHPPIIYPAPVFSGFGAAVVAGFQPAWAQNSTLTQIRPGGL